MLKLFSIWMNICFEMPNWPLHNDKGNGEHVGSIRYIHTVMQWKTPNWYKVPDKSCRWTTEWRPCLLEDKKNYLMAKLTLYWREMWKKRFVKNTNPAVNQRGENIILSGVLLHMGENDNIKKRRITHKFWSKSSWYQQES